MMILDKKVSVILMKKDNEGRYLSKLNKKAINILTEAFGGHYYYFRIRHMGG